MSSDLGKKGSDTSSQTQSRDESRGGGYDKKDAAADTGVSTKEVSRAWHDARDDAQKAGELPERAANKAAKGK